MVKLLNCWGVGMCVECSFFGPPAKFLFPSVHWFCIFCTAIIVCSSQATEWMHEVRKCDIENDSPRVICIESEYDFIKKSKKAESLQEVYYFI